MGRRGRYAGASADACPAICLPEISMPGRAMAIGAKRDDSRSKLASFSHACARALGIRGMDEGTCSTNPCEGLKAVDDADKLFGHSESANQVLQVRSFRTIADDDELIELPRRRYVPNRSLHVFAGDEAGYADRDAEVGELRAQSSDVAGDIGHIELDRFDDRNVLHELARPRLHGEQEVGHQVFGGEPPLPSAPRDGFRHALPQGGRKGDEESHVATMGDDLKRAAGCHSDRPRARDRPVSDRKVDRRDALQAVMGDRHPPGSGHGARGVLSDPRRHSRPTEGPSERWCNHEDLVSLAFEQTRFGLNEMARRVRTADGPARRDERYAHVCVAAWIV